MRCGNFSRTIKFYVMYGQTEATARISCMEPERWEEKPGSVGRAFGQPDSLDRG